MTTYSATGISRTFADHHFTSLETSVHAFIKSKLDYCNSLLYDCRKMQLKKLQYVQNMAARIITRTRKFDHIAPVLSDLHWLTVSHHIVF